MNFSRIMSFSLVLVIALVLIIWLFLPGYQIEKYGPVNDAGAYGDIYGSVTALFTSLAFALLIYTALMQREELKLQREELKLTREEIKKSAEAQAELVRLTRETNEFQKKSRKSQIRPELSIIGTSTESADISTYQTVVLLAPKFFALKLRSITILNDTELRLDKGHFNEHFLNRIKGVGDNISVLIRHQIPLNKIAFDILIRMEDVDGFGIVEQKISNRNGVLVSNDPVPVNS